MTIATIIDTFFGSSGINKILFSCHAEVTSCSATNVHTPGSFQDGAIVSESCSSTSCGSHKNIMAASIAASTVISSCFSEQTVGECISLRHRRMHTHTTHTHTHTATPPLIPCCYGTCRQGREVCACDGKWWTRATTATIIMMMRKRRVTALVRGVRGTMGRRSDK